MTGLLRTTLLFFLPIFIALVAYQTWVSNRLSPQEQKQIFREQNAATLNLVRNEAEKLLEEDETGKVQMPGTLAEENGVFLAEIYTSTGPIVSLLSATLMDSKTWSLLPDPEPSAAYSAAHQFLISPSTEAPAVRVVLFEETIYQPDGDPVRLNVYLERNRLASNE